MSPDVTIIIPTYNRLWSLPRAVESCRSTTIGVQIIVVDDASTDGTKAWLEAQSGISVVRTDGWGKPWAVNRAMPLATGKYIRFLDSDDWLNEGANEVQFALAEAEQADLAVAGVDLYLDDKLIERCDWLHTDDFVAQQLGETPGSHYSAFLFRGEFLDGLPHRTLFPASMAASRDDRCLMLEVALRHPRIAVCPVNTLCHRSHSRGRLQFHGGLAGTGTNIQQLNIYRRIVGMLTARGELTSRRARVAAKVLWPLAHWIAYSHLDDACEVVRWINELDPGFEPPERGLLGILYRRLGFRTTEHILATRRSLIALGRTRPKERGP